MVPYDTDEIGINQTQKTNVSQLEEHFLTKNKIFRKFKFKKKRRTTKKEILLTYYNFCRKHGTLKTTPAVKSGFTDSIWSVDRLLGEIA